MIGVSFRRLSYFDRKGPGFVVELQDRSMNGRRWRAEASRQRSLALRPPELGLSVLGLSLGGLVASGVPRYALFGLAWLSVAITFFEILPAILALMASGAAVVGLFGVNLEGFLAFIGLTLAGAAALVGGAAVLAGCVAFLRYLWGHRHRIPRVLTSRRGDRSLAPPTPSPNYSAPVDGRRLPSLSQCIVSMAVRRLPAEMCGDERRRWEEEMRGDVEDTFFLIRTIYALGIWLRGAPGMPGEMEDAPQNKPSRG